MKISPLFTRAVVVVVWILSSICGAHGLRAADWELVWSDEFNTPGLLDPAKWVYEQGYVRNNEAQFYTTARPENARVENGNLILEVRKDHYAIPAGSANAKGKTVAEYTSASVTTEGKQTWCYGKMEIRAKMPAGRGTWPAFWTLGDNMGKVGWPACGELDILEFVGKEIPMLLHGTIHYRSEGKHAASGQQIAVPDASTAFHRYSMEWSAQKIELFMDDQRYSSFDVDKAGLGADNPFRKPHYILLNFAEGGSWGGPIDDATLPQQYVLDYVHVYQAK